MLGKQLNIYLLKDESEDGPKIWVMKIVIYIFTVTSKEEKNA